MADTAPDPHEPRRPAIGDHLLVAGKGWFATHAITAAEIVIGRGAECDVVIDDPALSRRHAVLRLGPPATLQDLGSTNGVRVPGRGLVRGGAAVELDPTASFHLGGYSFLIASARRAEPSAASGVDQLRLDDPTIEGVPGFVRDVAATATSVLLLGESGVGKDVLAATIHTLSGRPGAHARINCAALSEALVESELFGHEKGAFTGAVATKVGLLETAARGTVFLDEIGELPLGTQAKLLRAIESREVTRLGAVRPIRIDVRFVAATHRDLPADVAAGRFRHDLYFRLDGISLVLTPLRERRHRIAPLAAGFAAQAYAHAGRAAVPLSLEVLAALEAHAWPGNVRELKAVVERAVLLARGGPIAVRHLAFSPPVAAERGAAPAAAPGAPAPDDPFDRFLSTLTDGERAERAALVAALDACGGNQTRAAAALGVSRSTLINRLRFYRVARPRD